MIRGALVIVSLAIATCAAAAADSAVDPMIGKLVPVGCRQGVCQWFVLEQKTLIGRNAAGALYEYVSKSLSEEIMLDCIVFST